MQISNCRFNGNVGSDEETSNNGYSEHPTDYPRRKRPKYLFKVYFLANQYSAFDNVGNYASLSRREISTT